MDEIDDALELVAEEPLSAHLATSLDDRPHVAPVWYVVTDDRIEFFTAGRKRKNIRRNPRVALSIEEPDVAWRAVFFGTAELIDDGEPFAETRRRLFEKYYDDPEPEDHGGGSFVSVSVGSADVVRY